MNKESHIMNIDRSLRPAVVLFVALTLITGVAYPLVITGIGRVALSHAAQGSLIEENGKVVGSTLIGQSSSDPRHFWSRPSATSPQPNNASSSTGSNLGPLNPALVDAVKGRVDALKAADHDAGVVNEGPVPIDLVTTSASGLDPHISPEGAAYQAARVSKATGLSRDRVDALVAAHTEAPQWGFLGMPRVNVLELNRAIDAASASRKAS
jgi:potassium-transporting ATPase KdpC subunit